MKNRTLILLIGLFIGGSLMADAPAAPDAPDAPPAPPAPPAKKGDAFLGVVSERVSKSLSVHLGLPKGFGLAVETVVKGSAAEAYGIEEYDILLELEGQMLTSVSHLGALLDMHKPGDTVRMKILRKGDAIEKDIVLGSKGKRSGKNEFSFNIESISELGERLQGLLADEERLQALEEQLPDAEEIEKRVQQALSKARYTVHSTHDDHEERTSIVHSGSTRTIVNTDDGTLIVESPKDGNYKVIAIDANDELLFSGKVSESGSELDAAAPWVKERFLKITNETVNIVVDEQVQVERDVDTDVNSQE
jgi:ElaB/YqjD/DUF883 family membrane-anchored ribosome-binding protein